MKGILTSLLILLVMVIGLSVIVAGRKGPTAVFKFFFAPVGCLLKCAWMLAIVALCVAVGLHSLTTSVRKVFSGNAGSSGLTQFAYPVGDDPEDAPKKGLGWSVTQDFQDDVHYPQEYPLTKGRHLGEDWAYNGGSGSSAGRPVFAIADGEVVFSGSNPSYGHAVLLRHRLSAGSDYPYVVSLYGHLGATDLLSVPSGATVKRGLMIGRVGRTGENGKSKSGADWPSHLHLELREDSSKTDFSDADLSGGGRWGYRSPPAGFLNPTDRRGEATGSGWIDRHLVGTYP